MATVLKEHLIINAGATFWRGSTKGRPFTSSIAKFIEILINRLLTNRSDWQEENRPPSTRLSLIHRFRFFDSGCFDRFPSRADAHFSSRDAVIAKTDSREINEAIASRNNNGEQVQCLSEIHSLFLPVSSRRTVAFT